MAMILIADDEERVRAFVGRSMAGEGHTVLAAADGAAALDLLRGSSIDLVLLDLVMPGMSGLECLRRIQDLPFPPPVLVLSGVSDVAARVQALEGGAVDFVSKPFHVSELLARSRRHLQAKALVPAGGPDGRFLEVGAIQLDLDRRRAISAHGETSLAEREFTLLAHLMRRHGRVCRKDELLHDVWGLDFDPGSNVVEVAVRRLRTKVAGLPVETVRGVGYCFVGE